jgi:predicted ATPase
MTLTQEFNMDSIRVKNLRCLVDTGEIHIKPLTILVGANSTGKSTFLRLFPLLRQSVETPTNSLILWYGRNGYVDFGTIKDALRDSAQAISFGFKLTLPKKGTYEDYGVFLPFGYDSVLVGNNKLNVEIELTPRKNNQTQISKLTLCLGADKAILIFDELDQVISFDVNTRPLINKLKPLRIKKTTTHFFPIFEKYDDFFIEYGEKLLKYLTHSPPQSFLETMLKTGISHHKISKLEEGNEQLIRDISFACHVPLLLSFADRKIYQFASQIQYVGPFRAVVDRYYRIQDLSVEEIDCRGENLPMYLDSLSPEQQEELDEWSKNYFGIKISIKNQGTHLAVMVKPDNASLKNLADVGFGYSQVLPIIIKLWSLQNQNSLQRLGYHPSLIAIEQPELHLHPQFQAQLADVFANLVKMNDETKPLRLLVETHGEALITRIGQLIGLGKLPAEDVQVILFDQDKENGGIKVSTTTFDEEGCLINWPYGFFIPDLPF